MAIRSSWATQNSGPTGTIDVGEARLAVPGGLLVPHTSSVKAKSGFRPGPTSPAAVTATGTPDANVHVSVFQLFLQSVRSEPTGAYVISSDTTVDINILSTPADPTNPRDDLIVIQQSDTFYGDGNSDAVVRHVVGTPAASPSDPAVSGSTDYVTIARVRVGAGVTTINNGNITDLRTSGHAKSLVGGLYSIAAGGLLPVASLAQRNALTGIYDGFAVWRQDLDRIEVYNGSAWRMFARPTENLVVTSETTASTSFTDLATSGPAVTLETGDAADVFLYAHLSNNTGGAFSIMSFAVSGASTQAAADSNALVNLGTNLLGMTASFLVTGLTAGSNTFTAKYRVSGGTGTFIHRRIRVDPK